jgi:phosphinothricin acetyltransferase
MDLVPRTAEAQRAWLADRSGAFATVVAVEGSDLVGFAALSPYKDRPGYRTSVEDSVYVRRDRQGRGLGGRLLTAILDVATANGFHAVFARVEASQAASRALHERAGFALVGVEREVGRKFNRWLDVALYECLLHERAAAG